MKTIATVKIVGEDESLSKLKELHLLPNGFDILSSTSLRDVEKSLPQSNLVIVNSGNMDIDGLDFVDFIQRKNNNIPIIFITHPLSEDKIEMAFEKGIDDYIVRPFSTIELFCRIKAILKRTHGIKRDRVIHRDIILNYNERECYIDDQEIKLTKLEFDLLAFFIENKHTILDREYILKEVWGDNLTQKRTINVRVNRLINKIDPDSSKGYISAIRGIGYRLD
ncbi:MAG TPA: response regulator transcription factor [Campylobacterales bacterium]|nr:response regulator transcription factor [Campylobacterales bacterium]HHH50936.1 response regulator transcription factor [Campylobacterales bacterium]